MMGTLKAVLGGIVMFGVWRLGFMDLDDDVWIDA